MLGLGFRRIQFTPDLLPGDLIGTPVYVPGGAALRGARGPIFAPILLADEINRAPAKVQSALLEAMEERQVTIGEETLRLPDPFLVMATQNPIDLEGTYPLPEAQVDRFLLKVVVSYPGYEEEREIVARDAGRAPGAARGDRAPSRCARCAARPARCTSRRPSPTTPCGSRARRASRRSPARASAAAPAAAARGRRVAARVALPGARRARAGRSSTAAPSRRPTT